MVSSSPFAAKSFQFTGLIRGPTIMYQHPAFRYYVSIHRPHTRPDVIVYGCRYVLGCRFNSQASYEARLAVSRYVFGSYFVSIHRPHTRPDFTARLAGAIHAVFQFTGLIRGPTETGTHREAGKEISIHRPHTRPDY